MKKTSNTQLKLKLFEESNISERVTPKLVSFRELVKEINNNCHFTHSTHYYPAKFIPQVVRYCINSFTTEKNCIIDPFAGSGTVGLEAYLCNRNSYLLELNPVLSHIMPVKIYKEKKLLEKSVLMNILDKMKKSEEKYYPKWSNINYWYKKEMLDVLANFWGYQKTLKKDIYSLILETSLLKASKQFSLAEHKIPKLFKSKRKQKYIEDLLNNNWEEKLLELIYLVSENLLNNINKFIRGTRDIKCFTKYYSGIDALSHVFEPGTYFDCLITSPPYLQAQEYIRTSKMDLFWLGYSESKIKKLTRLEIPYRKPSRIIKTKTLNKLKSIILRKDFQNILDSYFSLTIDILQKSISKIKSNSYICIFIGNPTIDGNEVEIWKILMEYFTEKGLLFKAVYEDRIKSRQLFRARNNKNPRGMKSEYLLILKKP